MNRIRKGDQVARHHRQEQGAERAKWFGSLAIKIVVSNVNLDQAPYQAESSG
jgi:hypothetical protein